MIRSFDPEVFRQAVEPYPTVFKPENGFDVDGWVADLKNVMFDEDGSVGFFSYEYPGVYTGHWFFRVRGKEANELAKRMLDAIFKMGAKAIRGLTETNLPHVIRAAKRLGFKSYGVKEFPEGKYEILILTKDEFYG